MNSLHKTIFVILCLLYNSGFSSNDKTSSAEVLNVRHYDGITASLSSSVSSRIANSRMDGGSYKSFYANNNGSISMRNQKVTFDYTGLATTTFENRYATSSTALPGPSNTNVTYEVLSATETKESFAEIAFLDSTTAVAISYTKKNAYLLLIDITSNPMAVTSRLSIPVSVACCMHTMNSKELFYIEPVTHKIILPVNKTTETTDSKGNLSWKCSSDATPGIWILTPIKNEDKRWVLDRSQVSVNYFTNESLITKGKNPFRIKTAHSDNSGNIWMSFTQGIVGVWPMIDGKSYGQQVMLFNFNKDVAWYSDMQKRFKDILYADLKNTVTDNNDTVNLRKSIDAHPSSYSQQYLENARYRLFANLEKEKNAQLDSNSYFEHPETLWKYVQLDLDNPMNKKKAKLVNYYGFKIRQFQTVQNGITTGSGNSVFVVTNLGLYNLSYNSNTSSISVNWSTPYQNSFIAAQGQKTASTGSTPTYIEGRDEVVLCDNAFPQVNMMILDSKTGSIKQQFSLFEYSYGSSCSNSISYSNNTIVAGNTFGNPYSCKGNQDNYPAGGVMKFTCYTPGQWRADYNWNKLQYTNPSNSAAPKISTADDRVYIYQHPLPSLGWQLSAISLNKADARNPVLFDLKPEYGITKMNLDNNQSNFTFGPKKSVWIGTMNGLLRIMSE